MCTIFRFFRKYRCLRYVRPEWWGARADDLTDSGPAFAQMVNEIEDNTRVLLCRGIYRLGDTAKNLFKTRTLTQGISFEGTAFSPNKAGSTLKFTGTADADAALFWFNNTTMGITFSRLEVDCNGLLGSAVHAFTDLGIFKPIKHMTFLDAFISGFTDTGVKIGNQTISGHDQDAFNYQFRNTQFRSGSGATCVQVDAVNAINIFFDMSSFGNESFDDGNEGGTRIKWIRGFNGGLSRCFNDDMQGHDALTDDHYFVDILDPEIPTVTNFHIRDCSGEDWRVLRTAGGGNHRIVVDGWKQSRNFETSLDNKAIDANTGSLTVSNCLFSHGIAQPKTIFVGNSAYIWNNWLENGQYSMLHPSNCWIDFVQQSFSPADGS